MEGIYQYIYTQKFIDKCVCMCLFKAIMFTVKFGTNLVILIFLPIHYLYLHLLPNKNKESNIKQDVTDLHKRTARVNADDNISPGRVSYQIISI